MKKLQKHTVCVAYACMSLLFIVSGISKIVDFSGAAASITSRGLPFAEVLIVLAIIFELVGGLLIFFKKKVCLGATLLITYLVIATIIFHIGDQQLMPFLTNVAILGGLLLVKSRACECGSCDTGKNKKKSKERGCCGGSCAC